MSRSADKESPINWQELSDSLGVETSSEIEYYFRGTAQLAGEAPVDDGIAVELSDAALQIAASADPSRETSGDGHDESTDTTRKAFMVNDPSFDSDSEPESVVESELGESATSKPQKPANELDLDWDSPPKPTAPPESAADQPEERPVKKPARRTRSKPAKKTRVAPAAPAKESGWDDLASSLGVSPPPTRHASPVSGSRDEETEEASADVTGDDRGSAAERAPATSRSSTRSIRRPASRQADDKSAEVAKPAAAEFGFGAGLLDSATQSGPEPESVLDEISVPVDLSIDEDDEPYQHEIESAGHGDREDARFADDIPDSDSNVDDEDDEDDAIAEVYDEFDDDYVEFEIEDLDPAARRGQRKPRPERAERPERPESRRESGTGKRTRSSQTEERAGFEEVDSDATEESRPPRRRRSRGRGRKATEVREREREPDLEREREPDLERDREPDLERDREPDLEPASARSEPRTRKTREEDDDDSRSGESRRKEGDSAARKARNLPTWNETVDVIVQANMSSRKKQPRRRRGGGGRGRRKD